MMIALGAAKGLAFLHNAERPVIYRDFKTSNILLDSVSDAIEILWGLCLKVIIMHSQFCSNIVLSGITCFLDLVFYANSLCCRII